MSNKSQTSFFNRFLDIYTILAFSGGTYSGNTQNFTFSVFQKCTKISSTKSIIFYLNLSMFYFYLNASLSWEQWLLNKK